jgi:hypothetical protein
MYSSEAIAAQRYSQPALVFYRIADDEPSTVNRLAAYITGTAGMAHVELRFRCGRSLSVFQDETVFLKKRGYSNLQYRAIGISIDPQAEEKMVRFAEAQVGKAFNTWGLRRAPLPWPLWRATDGEMPQGSWFCSELITATLQSGGMLMPMNAATSSPNELYDIAQSGVAGDVASGLNGAIAPSRLAIGERRNMVLFGVPCTPSHSTADLEADPLAVAHRREGGVMSLMPSLGRVQTSTATV